MFPNSVSGPNLSGLVGVCSFVLHKGILIIYDMHITFIVLLLH